MPRRQPSAPPPFFFRAAELRARGASWDAVAKEIGRTERTIRGWTRTFAAAWRKAVRDAGRQFAEEAAESVLTLRKQLRSEDAKVCREAAAALVKFAAGRKPVPRKKSDPKSRLTSQAAALAEFVGGLTDAEVTTLLRELRDEPSPAGTDAPPAAVAAAGTA
jgi:predicted transcriptional regulator